MGKDKKKLTFKEFLKKKDINFSAKTYFVDAMSGMAQGLFASLLVGTILSTAANYIEMIDLAFFQRLAHFMHVVGYITSANSPVTGAAIAVGIAAALKAPMLVTACAACVGAFANGYPGYIFDKAAIYIKNPTPAFSAGPLGVFVAVIFAVEIGKMISKETKVDILVTPIVSLGVGYLVAYLTCPAIAVAMNWLGTFINTATQLHPFIMGIIVSVVVGIILTLPISSAAICASIGITGIAGGAALAGCCAQMIGFAVASYRENKMGGIVSQGLGTSMLQMPNIVKNPRIWIPAIVSSAILGPVSTMVLHMESNAVGSGMGTSGLVGPISTFTTMTESGVSAVTVLIEILVMYFILPAGISLGVSELLRKIKWIKFGDMKLDT